MPKIAPAASDIATTINALSKPVDVSEPVVSALGVCSAKPATLAYPNTLAGIEENISICANRHIIKTVIPITMPAQMGKVKVSANGMFIISSKAIHAMMAPNMEQIMVLCNAVLSPPMAKKHAQEINAIQIKTMPDNGPKHIAAAIPPKIPILIDKAV